MRKVPFLSAGLNYTLSWGSLTENHQTVTVQILIFDAKQNKTRVFDRRLIIYVLPKKKEGESSRHLSSLFRDCCGCFLRMNILSEER